MAGRAVAQGTLVALRREIARIEGTLPERLAAPLAPAEPDGETGEGVCLRQGGRLRDHRLPTGVAALDAALGGGLVLPALTEIHAATARAAGAASSLVLALAALLLAQNRTPYPLLWLGTRDAFREAGHPYPPGLLAGYGLAHSQMMFAQAAKLRDALWIAEEAARLPDLAAVVVELRGDPALLDLTATRRLHRRAVEAGRPVFLLRQSARPSPTAAPIRLLAAPAPSGLRDTLAGPLAGSIGPPGMEVTVSKSPAARSGTFLLHWNSDERSLQSRSAGRWQPALPGAVVSAPFHGPDLAQAAGQVVDNPFARRSAAAGDLAAGKQHAADRIPRRAG